MNKSLQEMKQKYANCNLLMPMSAETQLNPFYKLTVSSVMADTSENSGDIFKVGTTKQGNSYVDVYSPAKPLLMKLAAAAGIQFDPNNTYGTYISRNCYKAKAYGALKMPDGCGKTHCDEKVINLDDEEDRFRLEFMDKAIQGITEEKAAKEAERLFPGGVWKDTVNKYNKACKAYVVPEKDRQTYIDRSVMVNMSLLRKTFAEKAMTGAILRVVRALIGLKGTYTLEELNKPFAVPKVTFAPDYNNPEVRQAMLMQGMNSMGNMFGTAAIPAATAEHTHIEPLDASFNPDSYADNDAFKSDSVSDDFSNDYDVPEIYESERGFSNDQVSMDMQEKQPVNTHMTGTNNTTHCESCGRDITARVAEYSMRQYGAALCMGCRKGA